MSCDIPPLPSSARKLSSFFPLTNGHTKLKCIEFPNAWFRAMRLIDMATGGSVRFPRQNIPLKGGTITSMTATTMTDTAADFTPSLCKRCGSITPLSGASLRVYAKDDPKYQCIVKIKSAPQVSGVYQSLTFDAVDWIDRGQVPSFASCVGLQYEIFAPGDISCYDRWIDSNPIEYVANIQIARDQGKAGSIGNLATKLITLSGSLAGTYTLNTGGSPTSAISVTAGATDLANAIGTGVGGQVSVVSLGGNVFAVAFGPGVSGTLTVATQPTTGTVAVSTPGSPLVVDPFAMTPFSKAPGSMPVNALITAPFKSASGKEFPDKPTSLVLLIYDIGGPAVSAIATATITPTGGLTLGQLAFIAATTGGLHYTTATVGITGGGGSGATATASIASGSTNAVSVILVGNAGVGYTTATATITGGGGSGATATPTIGAGGSITGFSISGGSGYTSAPTVAITGDGIGATAIAILGGGISGYTLTNRGSGYTSPPTITITGDGTGAAARPSLASGPITAITVGTGGSGYNSAPTVVIASTGVGDAGGSATATVTTGSVASVAVDSGGVYTVVPSISFSGGGGDSRVHRFAITGNTANTISLSSLSGFTPSTNFYYTIIAHDPFDGNSVWNPNIVPWARSTWYGGATQIETGLTHMPDDTIGTYPQPAQFVYFDGGDDPVDGGDACTGPTAFNATDQDVWNSCCDEFCCSAGDRAYSPNIWKPPRMWQKWLMGKGCPWVYLPAWTDLTQPPPCWDFATVMESLGFSGTGFDCPTFDAFVNINDLTAWIPSLAVADDGSTSVVDPPGVTNATDLPTATASISGGAVTGFTVTHGGAVTSVPVVTITGGGGNGARGTAVVTSGALSSITLVAGGVGYTSAPTVTLSGGGPVQIGLWTTKAASTHYLDANFILGEGTDSTTAFKAGDLAQVQKMNAYLPTMPNFNTTTDNPTAPYQDRLWTGTCGANPPNILYAGKKLRSSDPTSIDYNLYDSTSIDSDGTGLASITGPLSAVGSAKTGGLTTQIRVATNLWNYWFSTDTAGTIVSGSATGGTATTLVDSGATFTLAAWGQTLSVTHGSGPTAVTHSAVIDGVSADGKTLNASALGYTPVSGDTYTFTLPGGTQNVNPGTGSTFAITGIVTTGGTTSMIDATFANSPWFDPSWWPGKAILEVYHGTTSLVRMKFWINGTTQSSGTISVDAVDSQTITAGDRWCVRVTDTPHRFAKFWMSSKVAGGGLSALQDVKLRGNDYDTLFIEGTPPLGFIFTGGESVTVDTFPKGGVVKRDAANARWGSSYGALETRTDHTTGSKPSFHQNIRENWATTRNKTGVIEVWTIQTVKMWNEMFAVIKTLTDNLGDPSCTNNGEDNSTGYSCGTPPGTNCYKIYGPDFAPDTPDFDTAWGDVIGDFATHWPPFFAAPVDATCPQASVTVRAESPFVGDTRFLDGDVGDIEVTRNYSYVRDDNIPICLGNVTVDFYMYSQIDGSDTPPSTTGWPNAGEVVFDPQDTPLVYHQWALVDSASSGGTSSAVGTTQIGDISSVPNVKKPEDPTAHSSATVDASYGILAGFYVSGVLCIRNFSLSL